MFSWLKNLFQKSEPLPPLGFKPNFVNPERAPGGSVIVAIENDDTTPMEFVVQVLTSYFDMNYKDAVACMIRVHTEGSADIRTTNSADAKRLVAKVKQESENHGHSLQCYIKQAPIL